MRYLEVSQHDQTGGTDPGGGEARRVQDAVLVLLDHLSVAQQADQHHWNERNRGEHGQPEIPQLQHS